MEQKNVKRSEILRVQPRDVVILKFLDRVGYANVKQVAIATGTDGGEKSQAAVMRRLYLLRRFKYVKTFSTHQGNYYALDNKARGDNQLISSIKLDQLQHHDFLIELFLLVQNNTMCSYVVSEREAIATYKIVGKKGKVPDMVINDCIIEYERTNKSVADCKAVVDYWTSDQGKQLCIIYASDEIKNRYTALLNPRVILLARANYSDILRVIANLQPANVATDNSEQKNNDFLTNIKNKYS
jgi:hypothetical protein